MNIPFLSARRERARKQREDEARLREKAAVLAALRVVPDGLFFSGNRTLPPSFRFPHGTKVEVR